MGFFRKKADPINERSKALQADIDALQSEIKKLNRQLERGEVPTEVVRPKPSVPPPASAPAEPVFEELATGSRAKKKPEPLAAPEHYNHLGVRKFDLVGLFGRVQTHVGPKPTGNPKLVNLLAAGSMDGLRPLRYEKRIARNRFLAFAGLLLLLLLGIAAMIVKQR